MKTLSENVAALELVMASSDYKAGFQGAVSEACALREAIVDLVSNYTPKTMAEKDAEIPTRTWEAIRDKLTVGEGFITIPGDIYTIEHTPGVICSTITVNLDNTRRGEHLTMCLDNKLASWEFLKGLDDTCGREVRYHVRGKRSVPFKNSTPYQYRFCN